MDSNEERILEKVRRLFELAKSSNEYESAAAAAKAQEILHKYNLTRADVPESADAPYVKNNIRLASADRWRGRLMHVLAKANGAYLVSLGGADYAIMGQRHTLEIVEYSYQQMQRRIDWLADMAWQCYDGEGDARTFKSSFRDGIINSLSAKLTANKREMSNASPESRAMVAVADDRLSRAVAGWFPRLSSRRGNAYTHSQDGYSMGKAAGSHLNVNPRLHQGLGQHRLGS